MLSTHWGTLGISRSWVLSKPPSDTLRLLQEAKEGEAVLPENVVLNTWLYCTAQQGLRLLGKKIPVASALSSVSCSVCSRYL